MAAVAQTEADGSNVSNDGELGAALDWLCLHLTDDELQTSFRSRHDRSGGKGSRGGGGGGGGGRRVVKVVGSLEVVNNQSTARVMQTMSMGRLGFDSAEASAALDLNAKFPSQSSPAGSGSSSRRQRRGCAHR